MTAKRCIGTVALLAVILVYAQSATAALWEDSTAFMSDRVYFGAAGGVGILNGFVDYAVYAPDDYTGSISFDDNLYVYAYQVSNNITSPVGIDYFSVGLSPDAQVSDVTYDAAMGYAIPGGSNPTMSYKLPENAIYLYLIDNIGKGEYSTTLLLTSIYGPEMAYGYVSGGVTGGASMELPSPVPEPATLGLLIGGGLLAFRRNGTYRKANNEQAKEVRK